MFGTAKIYDAKCPHCNKIHPLFLGTEEGYVMCSCGAVLSEFEQDDTRTHLIYKVVEPRSAAHTFAYKMNHGMDDTPLKFDDGKDTWR